MFFDNFLILCKKKGLAPNAVAKEIGLSTATATKWKKGSTPNNSTLKKLSDYFNVSVDELLGTPSHTVSFSPQKEKLIKLIDQLDEPDMYKLEGILEEMLRNEKYITAATQGVS